MKKIVITGGTGRFAQYLKKIKSKHLLFFPSKKILDITNIKKIKKYFNKIKPDIIIHLAGLSRPMVIHEKEISKSINLNIIGTCNLVAACSEKKLKLYIFLLNMFTPVKGNYKETDSLLPTMNYGWSKLGGMCGSNV